MGPFTQWGKINQGLWDLEVWWSLSFVLDSPLEVGEMPNHVDHETLFVPSIKESM